MDTIRIAQLYHAANMEGLGDITDATRPRVVGLPQAPQNVPWWQQLISAGTSVANTLLLTRNQNPYVYGYGQPVPLGYQPQLPAQQISQGVGQGFTNFAAQFGISPTTMLLLIAGGTYLLLRQPPR